MSKNMYIISIFFNNFILQQKVQIIDAVPAAPCSKIIVVS